MATRQCIDTNQDPPASRAPTHMAHIPIIYRLPNELLMHIIEAIPEDQKMQTLAAMVRTCKLFSKFASQHLYRDLRVTAKYGILGEVIHCMFVSPELADKVETLRIETFHHARSILDEANWINPIFPLKMEQMAAALAVYDEVYIECGRDSQWDYSRWVKRIKESEPVALAGILITLLPKLKHLTLNVFWEREDGSIEPDACSLTEISPRHILGSMDNSFHTNIMTLRSLGTAPYLDMPFPSLRALEIDLSDTQRSYYPRFIMYDDDSEPRYEDLPNLNVEAVKIVMPIARITPTSSTYHSPGFHELMYGSYVMYWLGKLDGSAALHVHLTNTDHIGNGAFVDFRLMAFLVSFTRVQELVVTVDQPIIENSHMFIACMTGLTSAPTLRRITGPEYMFVSYGDPMSTENAPSNSESSSMGFHHVHEIVIHGVTFACDKFAVSIHANFISDFTSLRKVQLHHHEDRVHPIQTDHWDHLKTLGVDIMHYF